MSTIIIIGGTTLNATDVLEMPKFNQWDSRDAVRFKVPSTYEAIKNTFVEDAQWKMIAEGIETDMSAYSVPGPITDNRDGTITAMMGKPTDLEKMIETIYGGVNNAD